jgi:hypothetical protein
LRPLNSLPFLKEPNVAFEDPTRFDDNFRHFGGSSSTPADAFRHFEANDMSVVR